MKFMGFNFTKILVEKISTDEAKNINVDSKVDLSSIEKFSTPFMRDETLIVKFIFHLDFSPNYAKLELDGNILVTGDKKEVQEVLDKWSKKQLPDRFKLNLFNFILKKCNIKALSLEEELSLPLHIHLPSLTVKKD